MTVYKIRDYYLLLEEKDRESLGIQVSLLLTALHPAVLWAGCPMELGSSALPMCALAHCEQLWGKPYSTLASACSWQRLWCATTPERPVIPTW